MHFCAHRCSKTYILKFWMARRCSETHILILPDEPSRGIRWVDRAKLWRNANFKLLELLRALTWPCERLCFVSAEWRRALYLPSQSFEYGCPRKFALGSIPCSRCVALFPLCVFCLCFCLWFLSVVSLCVFSLCLLSVSSLCVFCLCVFSLCFLSVFSLCVFSLCFPSVFSLCVFCLCFLSVCFLSVFSLCVFSLCVSVCVFCLCFLSVFSVFSLFCVFSLCVYSLEI